MRLYTQHTSTFYDHVLALLAIASLVVAVKLFHQQLSDPKRVAQLAEMIHSEVCRHVILGHVRLCPRGTGTQIIHLRLSVGADGSAVIDQLDWDAYHKGLLSGRIFEIDPEDHATCHSNDGAWSAPLVRQLELLLEALRVYEPRFKVTRVSR